MKRLILFLLVFMRCHLCFAEVQNTHDYQELKENLSLIESALNSSSGPRLSEDELQRISQRINAFSSNDVFLRGVVQFWIQGGLANDPALRGTIESIASRAGTRENLDFLERVGFVEFWQLLGLTSSLRSGEVSTPRYSEAREFLIEQARLRRVQVDQTNRHLDRAMQTNSLVRNATERLRRGYIAASVLVTSGILGAGAYYGSPWVDWHSFPLPKIAGYLVVGINTSVWGFSALWSVIREPLQLFRFRHEHQEMVAALSELLKAEPETTIRVLMPTFNPNEHRLPFLESVSLASLTAVENKHTTNALIEIALISLQSGNTQRALEIMKAFEQRSNARELNQIGREIAEALSAKQNYENAVLKLRAHYMVTRLSIVGCVGVCLGLGLHQLHPDAISLFSVFATNAIAIVGVRPLLLRIWMDLPSQQVERRTLETRARLISSIRTLIKSHPRMASFVVALASSNHNRFVSEALREALHIPETETPASAMEEVAVRDVASRRSTELVHEALGGILSVHTKCLKMMEEITLAPNVFHQR